MPTIVEDWQWVVMTIIQEAALEPFQGKVMVAEVIRDRAESGFNSDGTIVGTVLKPFQFSGWNTEDKGRMTAAKFDLGDQIVSDSIKAYNEAFKKRTNHAMGANLYHADYLNPYPSWTNSPKVQRLTHFGHHIFYFEERP